MLYDARCLVLTATANTTQRCFFCGKGTCNSGMGGGQQTIRFSHSRQWMGLDIKLPTWERKVLSGTQRLYFSLFVSYLFVQHFSPLHTSSSRLGAGSCIFGLLGFFDSVDLLRWATPLLSKPSSLDWEFWAVAMMIMTMTDGRTDGLP